LAGPRSPHFGKAKSSTVPPRLSSQANKLARASEVISNCTGRPVFCWMTMDRARTAGPATSVPILIFTKSHPRSFLSIARSKSARSRMRPSRSRKKRIAQICRTFSALLAPTFRPAFQTGRPLAAGSYCEIPIVVLLRPPLANGETMLTKNVARGPEAAGVKQNYA
jgi:hypothetical protein